MKEYFLTLGIAAALAGCQSSLPSSANSVLPSATEAVSNTAGGVAQNAQPAATSASMAQYSAPSADTRNVDLTHLPLGDNRKSTAPKTGYIWACRTDPNAGGAQRDGPWIRSDETFDYSAKAVVSGEVKWQSNIQFTLNGDTRVITTNDLPSHPTGTYPIGSTDAAYQYDRNPNRIQSQNFRIELPANPTLAAQPACAPGTIGLLLSGSSLFNALDAPGRDAVAHETQDACQGHPQESGAYHYHNLTDCIQDKPSSDGHSALMGYMIDGFGIYGHHGIGGKTLTSADLDECHGHTHTIDWDGKKVEMYHYHATYDFPYTAGCIRGMFNPASVRAISGGPGGNNQNGAPQSGQPGGNQTPGQNGGQPPRPGQPGSNQPPSGNQLNGNPLNGQRPDLSAAAAKLGITEQKLRDALGPPPPDLAAAAAKLGITQAQLRAALGVP